MMTAQPVLTETPRPTAAARPAQAGRPVPPWVWPVPPLAVLVVVLVYPLAQIVLTSFTDNDGNAVGGATWGATLFDPAVLGALGTTLLVAALATVCCVVIGTFAALVLAFVPFPGSGAITRVIEAVVSFPSFLIPLAFGVLFGPVGVVNSAYMSITGAPTGPVDIMTSVTGVVLAETAFYTPFVIRPLLAAFESFPRAHINVASSLGASPARIVARIVLPQVWPALAAAGALTFLMTMNEFGIVLFTGAKGVVTLPMMIYTKAIVTFDFATASVIACIQLVLSLVAYLLYRRIFLSEGKSRAASQ